MTSSILPTREGETAALWLSCRAVVTARIVRGLSDMMKLQRRRMAYRSPLATYLIIMYIMANKRGENSSSPSVFWWRLASPSARYAYRGAYPA